MMMTQSEKDMLARLRSDLGLAPAPKVQHVNAQHEAIVIAGGGQYVAGMFGDLVLFNSPATGSTLALPEKELTAEAVARKLLISNQAFGK